jgi:uncharacterized protein (DUF305 family)
MNNAANPFRTRLSVGILVMAVLLGLASSGAIAHEPPKTDGAMPMSTDAMDHSKMAGMSGMDDMSMTGDVDYDFAANMRKHHQMAIDMAQKEVKNGKNPQMVQTAKDIIAAQAKEIAQFDEWLKSHKMSAPSAMPKTN